MNAWNDELWRLGGILLVSAIAGALMGHITLFLLIAVSSYLFWHLRNIRKLEQWLHIRGKFQPPKGNGIWSDVFDQIYRLQKRNRDRKKKLAAYLSRFQRSTSAMPDATVVLDRYGQIEWLNSAAQGLLRLKSGKDVGQHITNLIRTPAFKQFFEKGDYELPLEIPTPYDDQTFISVRVIPYGNKQRLLIARDTTRMKRLEQMRRDFIANISHELRTPLTVINGYVETMVDENDPALGHWQHSLQLMQQQSGRMRCIVEDLLTLSRLEIDADHIIKSNVSVPALLASIQEEALALSNNNHNIVLDINDQLWLKGVNNELHSAFSNLIFNAVRYTPEGGDINIRWYNDSSGAHLEVKDTGIGISPQHIPRLTERFYRVDIGRSRDSGGTGLGLAIVKHVIQRHRGRMRIYSRPGEGSTFCCDFPSSEILNQELQDSKSAAS